MTVRTVTALALAGLLITVAGNARGATCYVSPSGSDASLTPANPASPLRTLTFAVTPTGAPFTCETIIVKDGVYQERLLIQNRTNLLITAEHQHTPGSIGSGGVLLDVSTVPRMNAMYRQSAIAIYDSSDISIIGLRIRNDASGLCTTAPVSSSYCNSAGIDIRNVAIFGQPPLDAPSSHDVLLLANEVFDVRAPTLKQLANGTVCTSGVGCLRRFDTTPVSAYSDRDGFASGVPAPDEATRRIRIISNTIHHCDPNRDENGVPAINLRGNVEDVIVENNLIRNITSTALLTYSAGIVVGDHFLANGTSPPNYHPRKIVIRRNDMRFLSGAGVYVQGANYVLIERNAFRRMPTAVQVSTEHFPGLNAGQVWIRNNLIRNATVYAIDIGIQSAANYSGVDDVYITNNTITSRPSATTSGVLFHVILRSGVGGASRFANNLIRVQWPSPSPCTPSSTAATPCYYLFRRDVSTTAPMLATMSNNLWFVSSSLGGGIPFTSHALWCSLSAATGLHTCTGFAGHQAAGYDSPGSTLDPLLPFYALGSTSPARNAGGASSPPWGAAANFGIYAPATETDFYGNPRVVGGTVDIGMQELP